MDATTALPTHREAPPVAVSSRTQYRNKDPYAMDYNDDASTPVQEEETTQRRQYRNKDPYALPSDDEDETDMITPVAPVRKPQTQGESFIDFLKNTEPPAHLTKPPLAERMAGANGINGQASPQARGYAYNYGSEAGTTYTNGANNGNKLRKESSGGMRSRIFGKKVGAM